MSALVQELETTQVSEGKREALFPEIREESGVKKIHYGTTPELLQLVRIDRQFRSVEAAYSRASDLINELEKSLIKLAEEWHN